MINPLPDDEAADEIQSARQLRTAQIMAATRQHTGLQPDRAARVRQIAEREGIPVRVADRNPDVVEQRGTQRELSAVIEQNPQLADWIQQRAEARAPEVAKHADEVGLFAATIQSLRQVADMRNYVGGESAGPLLFVGDGAQSVAGGAAMLPGQALGGSSYILQSANTLTSSAISWAQGLATSGADDDDRAAMAQYMSERRASGQFRPSSENIKSLALSLRAAGDAYDEAVTKPLEIPASRRSLFTDTASAVGQMAGQIAAFIMTGGASGTALLLAQGADVAGDRILENEGEETLDTAAGAATVLGSSAVTAALERVGIAAVINRMPEPARNRVMSTVVDAMKAGGAEGITEMADGIAHDMIYRAMIDPDATIGQDAFRELLVGFNAGAMLRLVMRGRASVQAEQSAQEQAATMDQLVDYAANSNGDPGFNRELLDALAKGGPIENIYVPADKIRELFQSETDTWASETFEGAAYEAWQEADLTGGDVAIPLGQYATAMAEHHQTLREHIRTRPDDPSLDDIASGNAADTDAAAARAMLSAMQSRPDTAIYEDLRGQLLAAGTTPDVADRQAKLVDRIFSTLADRAGMDPMELYRRNQVTIRRPVPDALAQKPEMDSVLQSMIDALRADRLPSDSEVYGPSLLSWLVGQGGLRDDGGELASRDAGKARPGLISSRGMALDDAVVAAYEAGYIDTAPTQFAEQYTADGADSQTLLDLIDSELRGNPVFSTQSTNVDRERFRQTTEQLADYLSSTGVDVATASDADIMAALKRGMDAPADGGGLRELMQSISATGTIEVDGVQRPRANSEGAPIAGSDQALVNFWRWFGDSKVVDDQGRPLVVYHGTKSDFEAFRSGYAPGWGNGIYFTDNRVQAGEDFAWGEGGSVLPVYLSIQNPSNGQYPGDTAVEGTGAWGDISDSWEDAYEAWDESGGFASAVIRELGHDGIITSGSNNVDGMELVALSPEQIKSINNTGSFDGGDSRILYQSDIPAGQELVTLHNLSADNLLFADSIGGLAVPSLGITKAATPFNGFGGITLIGTAELGTPSASNPAFSADAYTQRFPSPIWAKVPGKKADKFIAQFGEAYNERDTDGVFEHLVNRPDRDKAIDEARNSATFMRAWLREQGETPAERVMEKRKPSTNAAWAGDAEFIAAVDAIADRGVDVRNLRPGGQEWAELSAAAKSALDRYVVDNYAEYAPDKVDAMRSFFTDNGFSDNGELSFGTGDAAVRFVFDQRQPTRESRGGTVFALREQIGDRMPQFEQWNAEKITPLFAEPKIELGRKKVPMTLDNIVKAMTKGPIVGSEKTMTFGGGQVKAAVAKRFRSLEDVKAARDQIVSSEVESDAVKAVEKLLDEYRAAATGFYKYKNHRGEVDTWSAMDDAMKALADAAKKPATVASMAAALRKNDFVGVDSETIDLGIASLQAIRQSVTDYFEAKPQRAVSLSEFAGAVIPKKAPDSVRDVLKKAGVPFREYDGEESRGAAVTEFSRELNDSVGGVLFQRSDTDKRGSIQIQPARESGRAFTINLFEKANLSTFLHESGHMFLEIMGDLAADPAASEQITADYQAILSFIGAETGQPIKTESHEKFARAFEAYLFEGKAPTAELAGAFARFKGWLMSVYKRLSELNVELTDEVRGVFDRMVATDAEIAAAQGQQEMQALFKEAAEAGFTPKQWEAYQRLQDDAAQASQEAAHRRVLSALKREQKAWWAEERAKVEDEVAGEINSLPVYIARAWLRSGKQADGSELPEGVTAWKLAKQPLLDRYGQEFLSRLRGLYTVKGGEDLDIAARFFGFSSGTAMVDQLAAAPDRSKRIKQETDQRMRERFGDPMMDGSLPDIAMKAAHNGKRLNAILADAQALAKLAGQPAPDAAGMRSAAEAAIGDRVVRQLRPSQYLRAERKAAKEAQKAFAKGNHALALQHKRQQLLNAHLFDAAAKAEDRVEKARSYMLRFARGRTREKLGKLSADLLAQADAVLDSVDMRRLTGRKLKDQQARAELLKRARDGEIIMNPRALARLEQIGRTPWVDLTVTEALSMRDTLAQLWAGARGSYEAMIHGQKMLIADMADDVAESVLKNGREIPVTLSAQGPLAGIRSTARSVFDSWLRPGALARQLDGGDEVGPVTRWIIEPIRSAYAERVLPELEKSREAVAELYAKHYGRKGMAALSQNAGVDDLLGGRYTKSEVLAMALNWGNADNRTALLQSSVGGIPVGLTENGVTRAFTKVLDARDWQFVQDVWSLLDSYWPQIREAERRRRGIMPKKVIADPFEIRTSDGQTLQIAGGYYRLRYSRELSAEQRGDDLEADMKDMQRGRHVTASTRAGSTHERIGSGGRPVLLSLNVIDRHLEETIRDIGLGDEVRAVMQVLNSKQVRSAFVATGQLEALDTLEMWLQDSATGELTAYNAWEKATAWARSGFTAAKIGFSMTTALLSFTGIPQTIAVVGSRWYAPAAARFAGSPAKWSKAVMEMSPFMKTRYSTAAWNRDVMDVRAFLGSENSPVPRQYRQVMQKVHSAMFLPIMVTQFPIDVTTWMAGYSKGVAQGVPDPVRYADSVVENAQTSGLFSDRSGIERGTLGPRTRQSAFVKLWTTLISYMLAKGNIAYESGSRLNRERDLKSAVGFATDITLLFIVEAILVMAMRGQLFDEDDEDVGDMAGRVALASVESAAASIPFVREISGARFGGGTTPVGALANDSFKLMAAVAKDADEEEVRLYTLKLASNIVGQLTGLPSSQFNRALDSFWREHVEGEDVAPVEYVLGRRN